MTAEKRQVSILQTLVDQAKSHPVGEGDKYGNLINMALEWALREDNVEALTEYANQFKLAELEAKRAELEAMIASLKPTKKGKK